MKNIFILWMMCISVVIINCFATISCNKKFDAPPTKDSANILSNTTIRDLKAMHVAGNFEQIKDDKIIEGVVIADDKSGNFYKEIIIQDSSGGILVRLDGYNLYANYPVGRRVFIKAKNLFLGDYNGLVQLGGSVDNSGSAPTLAPLASNLFNKYIIKGTLGNAVVPRVVTTSQLTTQLMDSFQNTLIQLDNFEFSSADTAKSFADTVNKLSVNYTLKNCSDNSIILRTSGYADFAGLNVPNGKGSVVAIYSVFGSSKQINIRDTSDIKFYYTRCDSGAASVLITIDSIRKLYKGSNIKLGAYKIAGIVISDAANKNISTGNVILQNANKGIAIYFGGTITYNIGDSLVVDVSGDSLINYKGSLEIKKSYGSAKPAPVATGLAVVPQQLTIKEINENYSALEYTLVKIVNASVTTSGIYSGSHTLNDGSGTIALFTSSSASFAAQTIPAGAHTWTGYLYQYNTTKEFQIRNTNDVQ
ncbi:MAG: DUF5689 domain-containing protein [Chitinophagaceae bacterium]